ncbi:hypothetical protein J2847_005281 [Azospirillum agricola]|uniref:hypothetical protein n=1 Tax=Azospirillum agricola TaxID=1720247 RepID=UPI001AE14BEF|nr:hypothetical protein [Azospirillum agricola]MBP2231958.1 hypothetical protein [Azospirillum agricola]
MTDSSAPMIVRLPVAVGGLTPFERLLLARLAWAGADRSGLLLHAALDARNGTAVSPDERAAVLACVETVGAAAGARQVLVITADGVFLVALKGAISSERPDAPSEAAFLPLAEADVRAEIRIMIEADAMLTTLSPEMVSDADIHEACRTVMGRPRLDDEEGTALFQAALAAIGAAERRLGCPS